MFCQGLSGLTSGRAGGGGAPKIFYDVLSGIIRTNVRASWGGRLLKPFMMFCQGLSGLTSGRAGGGEKTPKTFYDVLSGIIRTYVRAGWGGEDS